MLLQTVLWRPLNRWFLDIRTKFWLPSLGRVIHKLSWNSAKTKKALQKHQLSFFQLILKKKLLLRLESSHLSTQGSLTFDLDDENLSKYFKYCRCIHLIFECTWLKVIFNQFWKLNMGNKLHHTYIHFQKSPYIIIHSLHFQKIMCSINRKDTEVTPFHTWK